MVVDSPADNHSTAILNYFPYETDTFCVSAVYKQFHFDFDNGIASDDELAVT